jgi:DNA-binding MarR family transcriptional regulator
MDQSTGHGDEDRVGRGVFRDLDYRNQADFRCALRQFLHFSEEQARLAGITPQQHLLLLVVRGHRSYPSVSIGEVARALQIRHHGASLLVDRSVRRGLLSRREDPMDRRRALVSLTDEGQRILDTITEANRRELGALEGVLFRDSFRQALQAYADVGIRSANNQDFAG